MPAWNEASVRSDGLRNSSPSTLPASACGSGRSLQPRREREQVDDLVAREVGEVEESCFMTRSARESRVAQRRDVPRLEHERREDAHHVRVAAGAGQDVVRRAARAARPSPAAACAGRAGTRRPASRRPGPTTQVSRICCDSRRTLASRPFGLDDVDDRLDHRAGQRPAAEGRAEVVGLEVRARRGRDISSAAHGKPAPSALAVVSMSGATP